MSKSNSRRFVRAAWSLLSFQMIASIGAVAVTAWAAFVVQPRLAQAPEQAAVAPGVEAQAANTGAAAIAIAGESAVGQRLLAQLTEDPDGMGGQARFQWLRNEAIIPGAVEPVYVIAPGDAGGSIAVRAEYVDGAGNAESVVSAPMAVPVPPPLVAACRRDGNTFIVQANVPWCETGIFLRAGQSIGFSVQGQWAYAPRRVHGPEGANGFVSPDTQLPSAPVAALIGRVGDQAFPIGGGRTFTSRANGALHLGFNDVPGAYEDNQGEMFVSVFLNFDER